MRIYSRILNLRFFFIIAAVDAFIVVVVVVVAVGVYAISNKSFGYDYNFDLNDLLLVSLI